MDKIRRRIKQIDWSIPFDIYSLFDKEKANIHPAELAEVLSHIPIEHALPIFESFSDNLKAYIFSYLEFPDQIILIKRLSTAQVGAILNNLSSDDRTQFFRDLSNEDRTNYLVLLNEENRKSTLDWLGYDEKSVARLVNEDFATIYKYMTVAEASEHLRKYHIDSEAANVVYVIDEDGKLLDDIQIRRLVMNEPERPVSDLMDGDYISLNIKDSVDDAIDKFMDYDRVVIPVVNDTHILVGVVTVDDIMDEFEARETEDIQKFGGVDKLDYPYVQTNFFKLTQKRATWLVVLFVGEMLTATAMSFYEEEIAAAVVLALFVPLVISSGGNSGSQAATLIIRALSLKEITLKDWWFVMRREILSGLTLGGILGAMGFFRIVAWHNFQWYDYGEHWLLIALTIFFSLIGIVLWGTLAGSMVPLLLKRLNLDPATSSAPFVATLVDVTGLIIYFSVAALILSGTLL